MRRYYWPLLSDVVRPSFEIYKLLIRVRVWGWVRVMVEFGTSSAFAFQGMG